MHISLEASLSSLATVAPNVAAVVVGGAVANTCMLMHATCNCYCQKRSAHSGTHCQRTQFCGFLSKLAYFGERIAEGKKSG